MVTRSKHSPTRDTSDRAVFRPLVDETPHPSTPPPKMNLNDAVRFIEGHGDHDERFRAAQEVINQRLAQTHDPEEKATCHYYSLRLLLREHLFFENKAARDLYQKMKEDFSLCEANYKKEFFATKNPIQKKIVRSQVEAFYHLVDAYLAALETNYRKRGFLKADERTHEDRMRFRKHFAFFAGKHFAHFGHLFLDKTSRYGHSFGRWGVTVIIFITLFAGIFALLDRLSNTSMFMDYTHNSGIVDYLYFSIVTFTTLGYGDIVPITIAEKMIVGIEALLGLLMLGVFINLIKRRL